MLESKSETTVQEMIVVSDVKVVPLRGKPIYCNVKIERQIVNDMNSFKDEGIELAIFNLSDGVFSVEDDYMSIVDVYGKNKVVVRINRATVGLQCSFTFASVALDNVFFTEDIDFEPFAKIKMGETT